MFVAIIRFLLPFLMRVEYIIADCGFPGLSRYSQLSLTKELYSENETVVYKCDDYPLHYKQLLRTCVDGSWTGSTPRCGKKIQFVIERIVERVKHVEVYRNEDQRQNFSSINVRLSLADSVNGSHANAVKIDIIMAHKMAINVIELWLQFDNTSDALDSLTVFVQFRKCLLDYQTTVDDSYLIAFIVCDLIEKSDYTNNTADSIAIELYLNSNVSVSLKKILIYKYGNSCGLVERPHNSHSGVEFIAESDSGYEIICSQNRNYYPVNYSADKVWLISCGPDAKWSDKFPECESTEPCSLISSKDKLIFYHKKSPQILNDIMINRSTTVAVHKCRNRSHEIVGDGRRECNDGQWSGFEPKCRYVYGFIATPPTSSSAESGVKYRLEIIVMSASVFSALVAVLLLCVKYRNSRRKKVRKKKKSESSKTISGQRMVKSEMYADVMDSSNRFNQENMTRFSEFVESPEKSEKSEPEEETHSDGDYEIINCRYENFDVIANQPESGRSGEPVYTVIL